MRRAIVLTVALGTLSGAAGAQAPAMGPEFQGGSRREEPEIGTSPKRFAVSGAMWKTP